MTGTLNLSNVLINYTTMYLKCNAYDNNSKIVLFEHLISVLS